MGVPEHTVDGKIHDLYEVTVALHNRQEAMRRDMHDRFDGVDLRLGRLETDVAGLKTDVGVLKTDVGGLKTDVGEMSTKVDRILELLQQNH
ncbi:hypothetical protein [Amycolatopsis taiwanensis]|uniref:hypothetical protein n=1 Tax=Amycolatopsis taiwanensis TaxID=342230 RepID=UPI0004B22456|nr:hypothetical protein [Amycolatopsis taiwanensis]